MTETQLKGLTTELQCQLYLTSLGYNISIPLASDCRYDMIADIEGKLIRIQVKTSHLAESGNGIIFATRSTQGGNTTHGVINNRYNEEEVDYFATFWDGKCYLLKIDDCLGATRTLMFEQKVSNQYALYFIENYETEKTLNRLINNLPEPKVQTRIFQLDKDYNIIADYENCAEASEKLFGDKSKKSQINAAISGKQKTAYGYIWERRFI